MRRQAMGKTRHGSSEGLRERLVKLGEFCSTFEAKGFKFGEMRVADLMLTAKPKNRTSLLVRRRNGSINIAINMAGCSPSLLARMDQVDRGH
jgi:hypothetical protein